MNNRFRFEISSNGVLAAIVVLVAVFFGVANAMAGFPERPITLICPWGAGGGTDTVARALAVGMEKELGQPVNVVNRTGGSGIIGHSALATAKPDGYTIGTINVDLSQLVCKGLTDLSYDKFTQIALINAAPAGLEVNANSPFKTARELLDAIKRDPPRTYKASGTGTGGIWHLAWAGWLYKSGVDPNKVPWVPTKGEAPSLKDLASGSVDAVTAPLSSALPLIKAGKVRPLANMDTERFGPLPEVPTLQEATGTDWSCFTWRMIGAPAGVPDDVKSRLVQAVKSAFDSDEFTAFMKKRGFKKTWKAPADARAFHQQQDESICEVMKAVGMAQ
jgi:tripartite-type tricarboxylate transporter receptor subunit TctC